jgi:hypothetical protein
LRLEEFREKVKQEFGTHLERATPANVREFLDRLGQQRNGSRKEKRIELNEPKSTMEDIYSDFFVRVLDAPTDEAFIELWMTAFELYFFLQERHLDEQLRSLFGETD